MIERKKNRPAATHRRRRGRVTAVVRTALVVFCLLPAAYGQLGNQTRGIQAGQRPSLLRDVDFAQRLNEQVPLDLVFRNEQGQAVKLGDYFGRKPIILALVYYECPMLCTQVLTGLASALDVLRFNVGDEFDIVTVSFDPREQPDLAARKKDRYVKRYGRPGAAAGWHFLTGEQPAIEALTGAVGFRYAFDPESGQFAHASGIVILTPEGKISRYFYGWEYGPKDLRLGLVEASQHKIGSPIDRVLLFCYEYNPTTGKYALILNIYRAGGVLTVLGFIALVIVLRRRTPAHARLKVGGAV